MAHIWLVPRHLIVVFALVVDYSTSPFLHSADIFLFPERESFPSVGCKACMFSVLEGARSVDLFPN